MSNDGIVQVPADSTGGKIDCASIGVAGNTVFRQRMIIGDNSASAQFATVTGNALLVQPNAVAISGTAAVVVGAGTANIGSINNISATVNVVMATQPNVAISGTVIVAISTPFIIQGISTTVNVAGTFAIGTIDKISATVVSVISNFVDSSGNNRNVVDSANTALRVNVVAGAAAGVSQTDDTTFSTGAAPFIPIGGVFSDAGNGLSLSASHAGATRMTGFRALHMNIRDASGNELGGTNALRVGVSGFFDGSGTNRVVVDSPSLALRVNLVAASVTAIAVLGAGAANIGIINNISATVNVAVTSIGPIAISNTPSVVLAAGTANFGTLNDISRTVQVAIGTPFTLNNISRTVEVTVSTPFTINAISATVTVTTANPYIIGQPSASHGPISVIRSTSATATFIAAPGAALHIYVTSLAVANGGTVLTNVQVGWSASLAQVNMAAAANGGGFVWNFDPPWKIQSNEAVLCRCDPNPGGNLYMNINFYVSS